VIKIDEKNQSDKYLGMKGVYVTSIYDNKFNRNSTKDYWCNKIVRTTGCELASEHVEVTTMLQ
jgi:hypothetical protein